MEMAVPSRVHVAPVGYEEERVYDAAKDLNADKVVLIGHRPDLEAENYPRGREHFDNIQRELDNLGIEHSFESCDIFDLYDSLGTTSEIITAHQNDDVYVNITTGSKITAVAGTIASMVTNATAYYVRGEYESVQADNPPIVASITKIPQYPIHEPDSDQINILNFLKEKQKEGVNVTKGDLINFSEYQGLSYINKDVSQKAEYRLLDVHVIEPLGQQGYITVNREGREKIIKITEKGENMLRAFRYMIDTVPEASDAS